MLGVNFMTLEEYNNWKLKEEYKLATNSYELLNRIYKRPGKCFNFSDIQAIEKAYFKQENKLRKLKSLCIRKGIVSLQE